MKITSNLHRTLADSTPRVRSTPVREASDEDSEYEVVVSNVGTVYHGPDEAKAKKTYADYVKASRSGSGRGGHEAVTLMMDGDIIDEYDPDQNESVTEADSGVEREDTPVKIALSGLATGFLKTLNADEELLRRLDDAIGHYTATDNMYHNTNADVAKVMLAMKKFINTHENWRATVNEYLSKYGW